MKKAILMIFLLIAALTSVIADKVGSPDEECQAKGFDFGVAKYQCNDGVFTFDEAGSATGYTITVTGTSGSVCDTFDWTASPAVSGILVKSGNDYAVFSGGTSGSIDNQDAQGISHITMCKNTEEVPEFTALGALLGLAVVAGIFFVVRR